MTDAPYHRELAELLFERHLPSDPVRTTAAGRIVVQGYLLDPEVNGEPTNPGHTAALPPVAPTP